MKIVLEINQEDQKLIEELPAAFPDEVEIVRVARFDGTSDLLQVLITLSPLTLALVAKVIIEMIRSKRYNRVRTNGIEITGFTAKNTIKMLEKLMQENPNE